MTYPKFNAAIETTQVKLGHGSLRKNWDPKT